MAFEEFMEKSNCKVMMTSILELQTLIEKQSVVKLNQKTPVSYTHLDVYKRQHSYSACYNLQYDKIALQGYDFKLHI